MNLTDQVFTDNAEKTIIFGADNASGDGKMLVQVTYLNGANGSVQISAALQPNHTNIPQGAPITEDALIVMSYCPLVYVEITDFLAPGGILISVFSN